MLSDPTHAYSSSDASEKGFCSKHRNFVLCLVSIIVVCVALAITLPIVLRHSSNNNNKELSVPNSSGSTGGNAPVVVTPPSPPTSSPPAPSLTSEGTVGICPDSCANAGVCQPDGTCSCPLLTDDQDCYNCTFIDRSGFITDTKFSFCSCDCSETPVLISLQANNETLPITTGSGDVTTINDASVSGITTLQFRLPTSWGSTITSKVENIVIQVLVSFPISGDELVSSYQWQPVNSTIVASETSGGPLLLDVPLAVQDGVNLLQFLVDFGIEGDDSLFGDNSTLFTDDQIAALNISESKTNSSTSVNSADSNSGQNITQPYYFAPFSIAVYAGSPRTGFQIQVIDGVLGMPLEGVVVSCESIDHNLHLSGTSDSNGNLTFRQLPATMEFAIAAIAKDSSGAIAGRNLVVITEQFQLLPIQMILTSTPDPTPGLSSDISDSLNAKGWQLDQTSGSNLSMEVSEGGFKYLLFSNQLVNVSVDDFVPQQVSMAVQNADVTTSIRASDGKRNLRGSRHSSRRILSLSQPNDIPTSACSSESPSHPDNQMKEITTLVLNTAPVQGPVSIFRSFVPKGVAPLRIDYRFETDEYPDYFGTQYNDGYSISVNADGTIRTIAYNMNGLGSASFDAFGDTQWKSFQMPLNPSRSPDASVEILLSVANVADGAVQSSIRVRVLQQSKLKIQVVPLDVGNPLKYLSVTKASRPGVFTLPLWGIISLKGDKGDLLTKLTAYVMHGSSRVEGTIDPNAFSKLQSDFAQTGSAKLSQKNENNPLITFSFADIESCVGQTSVSGKDDSVQMMFYGETQNGAYDSQTTAPLRTMIYYDNPSAKYISTDDFKKEYKPPNFGNMWIQPHVKQSLDTITALNIPELGWNDASNIHGGPFSPHGSHQDGLDIDLAFSNLKDTSSGKCNEPDCAVTASAVSTMKKIFDSVGGASTLTKIFTWYDNTDLSDPTFKLIQTTFGKWAGNVQAISGHCCHVHLRFK